MLDYEKLGAFYLGKRFDADPITSREHILISRILDHAWQEGRSLDIASLIGEIQVKAKVADVHVAMVGLVWMPYRDSGDGRLVAAW